MGDETGITCLILSDNSHGHHGCLASSLVVLSVHSSTTIWSVSDISHDKSWNANFGFVLVEVRDDAGRWKGRRRESFMSESPKLNTDIADVFMHLCWEGNRRGRHVKPLMEATAMCLDAHTVSETMRYSNIPDRVFSSRGIQMACRRWSLLSWLRQWRTAKQRMFVKGERQATRMFAYLGHVHQEMLPFHCDLHYGYCGFPTWSHQA